MTQFRVGETGVTQFRVGEMGVGEMGQIIGETGVGEMGVIRHTHRASLFGSCCSTLLLSIFPIVRYTAVSSANRRTFKISSSGRSLI